MELLRECSSAQSRTACGSNDCKNREDDSPKEMSSEEAEKRGHEKKRRENVEHERESHW
jgi:hypothetical protein